MKFDGFIGSSYQSRSLNFDAQRSVNLMPQKSEVGDSKNVNALASTPGLTTFIDFNEAPPIPNIFAFTYQDNNDSSYGVAIYDVDNDYAPIDFDNSIFSASDGLNYLRLSQDDQYLGILSYPQDDATQGIFLYDTSTWEEVSYGDILKDTSPYYEQIAFSSTMIGLASDSGSIPDFMFYDINTRAELHTISDGTGGYGQCIGFSPDGSLVAIGSYSSSGAFGNVRVLNTSDWSSVTIPTTAIGKHDVQDVKFSPDGNYLAAVVKHATDNNALHIWDTATWTHTSAIPNSNMASVSGFTIGMCWAPDSSEILLGYVPAVVSQPIGGPYVTWYLHIAIPSFTITYLYGSHVDAGGSRTYQDITNPVSWSQNGNTLFLCDATNNDVTTFDTSGTQTNSLSLPNAVISAMTKTGDV